jgi:hypothetical protein
LPRRQVATRDELQRKEDYQLLCPFLRSDG